MIPSNPGSLPRSGGHPGISALTNAFPSGVPDGLVSSFYDFALNGTLKQDWGALRTQAYGGLTANFASVGAPYVTRPATPLPALPLGTSTNDDFGPLGVTQENGRLILRLGPQRKTFPLTHFDHDIFTSLLEPEPPAVNVGVTFTVGPDRRAQSVVLENDNGDGQGTFTRVQPLQ